MKKLLFLFLIFPLFFACKHNTSSGSQQEPEPVPACSSDSDCASRDDGKTVCRSGECVEPTPECTTNENCRSGFHCDGNHHCVAD